MNKSMLVPKRDSNFLSIFSKSFMLSAFSSIITNTIFCEQGEFL